MTAHAAGFAGRLRQFSFNGAPTEEFEQAGFRYFVNEFWTAGQRQAHSIHEISYRACFKPQLPEFFIARLTERGDTVYDPFSGRGTTAVQAALMGRRPVGNDVNPLSEILVSPRLAPPQFDSITARLNDLDLAPIARGHDLFSTPCSSGCEGSAGGAIRSSVEPADLSFSEPDSDLLAFYHPDTLRQIRSLRSYLLARQADRCIDALDEWIRMVAINRLTGHSPGFFSVYTLPPNQAVSIASQQKINLARQQVPPPRDVGAIILKKTRTLLADGLPTEHPPALLMTGPAHRTAQLRDAEVDLIVTSPPFLDVVDYEGDNWLRCWFAGIDVKSVRIDRHNDIRAWQGFVRRSFEEFARVVRPGGIVAFEVGEVRGGTILLERHAAEAIRTLPFRVIGIMVNQQAFTKTANCWGVNNNRRGTNTNRIVIAERIR